LLTADGHVSIIDLNIAQRLNKEGIIENPKKKAVGTTPYMGMPLLHFAVCSC
jgi:hypothetical protein